MSTQTALGKYYLSSVAGLGNLYLSLVQRTMKHEPTAWHRFRESLQSVLQYADLRSATVVRWRALREPLKRSKVSDLDAIAEANPWYFSHAAATSPAIITRAAAIATEEARYWTARTKGFGMIPGTETRETPAYRLRRQFRDSLSDVVNRSEQLELANPDISNAFPFWVYETREDQRVRPTHAAMDGLVAVNSWPGWLQIRPPAGFGCRCSLRYCTIHEARRSGWVTKDDTPKWEVQWPATAARLNFTKGVFPDPKFQGPRYVQLGTFGRTP